MTGANDGDRTRDNRYHKPALYRLSYVRHTVSCHLENMGNVVNDLLSHLSGIFMPQDEAIHEDDEGLLPTELAACRRQSGRNDWEPGLRTDHKKRKRG